MINTTNFNRLLCLIFSIVVMPFFLDAQNCFDADFESGTLGGYEAYHGTIHSNGIIEFHAQEISNEQHRIMHISDGYDPIANQFCFLNDELRVTGSGTGRYTLRLGDVQNGARTSKVVLSFDVTADVSFFLLKYAIVINDPSHDHSVQPRFELNIKDQDGNILDCGEYKVRAEANIDGFESCADWRIRPWTTAGFELESYLGQTISIEILSTDCGLGGHGGYAYIDATCSPLRLDLESYCPGNGFARYVVTEGFDSYEWSTGETTDFLDIDNPIPGTEYEVTVTSSTGCTLVLRDTLPQIPSLADLEPSFFDGPQTINACFGEEIIYTPTGTNIGEVYAIELGYESDEFYLLAEQDRVIHFVTQDNFGCESDTTELTIYVENLDVGIETVSTCEGEANGAILIDHYGVSNLVTSLNGSDFQNVFEYTDLATGYYDLKFTLGSCIVSKQVVVLDVPPPELDNILIAHASCGLDNGSIELDAHGAGIEFSFEGSEFGVQDTWEDLGEGTYEILFKEGEFGCSSKEVIDIVAYEMPVLEVRAIEDATCGFDNGIIQLKTTGGFPPLEYSKNGSNFVSDPDFTNLQAGDYNTLVVKDADDCRDTTHATVKSIPYIQMDSLSFTHSSCEEDNGIIDITMIDESIPHDIFLDEEEVATLYLDGLASGLHEVEIIDDNDCRIRELVYLNAIEIPKIDSISFIAQRCINDQIKAIIASSPDDTGIEYRLDDGDYRADSIFVLKPKTNLITLRDEYGCEIDTVLSLYSEENFFMANIFSPNGDEDNDFFCYQMEEGLDYVEAFLIYDRWGELVYRLEEPTSDIEQVCWDGTFQNEPAALGVYVYYIEVQLTDGRLMCQYGDVTVSR